MRTGDRRRRGAQESFAAARGTDRGVGRAAARAAARTATRAATRGVVRPAARVGVRPGARGAVRAALCALLVLAASPFGAASAPAAHGLRGGSAAARLLWFDQGGADRARAELDRTAQVLQRAEENLRDCASPKATALLNQAVELQRKAIGLYENAGSPGPNRQVVALTLHARELAVDAIETCQVEFKAHESLRAMLDSTSELLRDANTSVTASRSPEARRLLDAGIWQLDKAREAYRAGEYRRAILLGGAARNLILRAVSRSSGAAEGPGPAARVEVALERTDLLLADLRSTPGLQADPKARALLDGAEEAQEQARELLGRGRAAAALRRTQAARADALDALWRLARALDPGRIEDAAELVDRFLEETAPEIRASGSRDALALLEEARQQLAEAREDLARGDTERAAQGVRTADSLLRRAAERAGR